MKAITYGNDLGDQIEVGDIPAELQPLADEWREKMIEALADLDDDIAHKFLEGEEIGADELRRALRAGTLAYKIVPVLTGSALKNKGVQPMLDAVIDFLPSPLDVPPMTGKDPRSGEELTFARPIPSEPFTALAFKIATDPFVGNARLLPGLLRHAEDRLVRVQQHQGRQGARRAHPPDARQPPRGDRVRSAPATSPPRSG